LLEDNKIISGLKKIIKEPDWKKKQICKSNKTIWMFYGKFADKGDNPDDNINRYSGGRQ
jgi:hypothetical protein